MFFCCNGIIFPDRMLKAAGLKKCGDPKKKRRIVENPLIVKAEMRERMIRLFKPRIVKIKKPKRRVRIVKSEDSLKSAS